MTTLTQLELPLTGRQFVQTAQRVAVPPALPPYQKHSPTSKAAAEALAPREPSLRDHVLRFFRACGREGATDKHVDDALRAAGVRFANTLRPRRVKLVEQGHVLDSGRVVTDPDTGRECTIWVAREYA